MGGYYREFWISVFPKINKIGYPIGYPKINKT